MHIRSLPRSRRSRNCRRNGRWIRSAILDRNWVAPNAIIGLYLLDDKRREVERAHDYQGRPIELGPHTPAYELERIVAGLGDGLYRLVARDRAGKILARRDFAAAMWSVPDVHQRGHAPRTEVEKLKAALNQARSAAEEVAAERDAARAEAAASKQAIAERDAEINALESALESKEQQLRRARRLYARLSAGSAPDPGPTPDEQVGDGREPSGEPSAPSPRTRKRDYRPRRATRPERPPKARHTDDGSGAPAETASTAPRGGEFDLAKFEGLLDVVAKHFKAWRRSDRPPGDEPAPDESDGPGSGGDSEARGEPASEDAS